MKTKTYQCLSCGKECRYYVSKVNRFCDNKCQADYQWIFITRPRILRGECSGPVALRKFLTETHGNKCSGCDTPDVWQGQPLTLHVDHIDGDSDNNAPDNLRLLCPNCHSQTPTFGRKGKGKRYNKGTKRAEYNRQYRASLVQR